MKSVFRSGLFARHFSLLSKIKAQGKAFVRDRDGATAIEFTILAAPFLALIYYLISLGVVYINATALTDATQQASRQIRIGEVAKNNMNIDGFKKIVCEAVFLSRNSCLTELVIDVTSSPDISKLNTSAPTENGKLDSSKQTFQPGGSSDYVIVKAYLPSHAMSGMFSLLNSGSTPAFTLSSVEVFRNEPF